VSGRSEAFAWGSGVGGRKAREAPRFRVQYRLPERLVAEVARCVNGGFSTLDVPAPQVVGRRLVFELSAWLIPRTVELQAVVLATMPLPDGRCRIALRYWLTRRGGLDDALYRLLNFRDTEPLRRSPRMPVRLPAVADDGAEAYLVKDLSLGGAGVDLEGSATPRGLGVGAHVKLTVILDEKKTFSRSGQVVWVRPHASPDGRTRPGFGVELSGRIDVEGLEALDRILMLKSTPRCTWLSLG